MSRYRFIEAQRAHYPVRLLCRLVAVPASGYYAWQRAQCKLPRLVSQSKLESGRLFEFHRG